MAQGSLEKRLRSNIHRTVAAGRRLPRAPDPMNFWAQLSQMRAYEVFTSIGPLAKYIRLIFAQGAAGQFPFPDLPAYARSQRRKKIILALLFAFLNVAALGLCVYFPLLILVPYFSLSLFLIFKTFSMIGKFLKQVVIVFYKLYNIIINNQCAIRGAKILHIAPFGRTLKHPLLDQGPARCTLDAYVPRLITSTSS